MLGANPIVIFHNGSAQRGHTVDYNPHLRHIYHHFGCGTAEWIPTYFADTFWVHPMEYHREFLELKQKGIIPPKSWCSPEAKIITPFDMLIDHATEAYIGWQNGEREFGSCGYGTWCATDREAYGYHIYKIKDFLNASYDEMRENLKSIFDQCLNILVSRKVNLDKIPEYSKYFIENQYYINTVEHFIEDLKIFMFYNYFITFDKLYEMPFNFIFENAQGLGLDKDCGKEWHTTSSTGLTNPYNMLKDKEDFEAEVCYVSRSYVTRHGIGALEEETLKEEINADMVDKTNVTNEFQGSLRYAGMAEKAMEDRINKDWNIINGDSRFYKTLAITHCNEFPDLHKNSNYISNNPFTLYKK